jgi:hypothetical protein
MKTEKVTFLKSHPRYGYFAGDAAELSPEAVEELTAGKYVQVTAPEAAKVAPKAEPKKGKK